MLESIIQSKIIKQLREDGWLVIRLRATDSAGWPDILALRNNQAVFIEVKRPGGKLSRMQELKIELLRGEGFNVIVTDAPIKISSL